MRRDHDRRGITRRRFLRGVAGGALALPFFELAAGRPVAAMDGTSRRLIVFYFPDGVPGASADGEPSLWHPTGSEFGFELPDVLGALRPYREQCVFFNGLSMGPTDMGSHPGGAKKLLTAVDGGNGMSLDQALARGVGSSAPHRHIYLGVQATQNGASGDKHISYVGPGATTPPEDNPRRAFERLFTGATGTVGGTLDELAARQISVLDTAADEIDTLRTRLDARDAERLTRHLESLREVEARLQASLEAAPPEASCADPGIDVSVGDDSSALSDPSRFPELMRSQIDVMVTAMACGLSRVGVLQASMHTSELIMSRFPGTELYDPGYDMRSHQASHYGARHDFGHREFAEYVDQRAWFVAQFAYLLGELAARPEGDGTMLDHTTLLLCSEVSDGNTHSHDDMPFVVAGGGGGAIRGGRLMNLGYHRHGDLLGALGRTLGADYDTFGVGSGRRLELG